MSMSYIANPVGLSLIIRAHQRGAHRKYPLRHCPMCRAAKALAVRDAVAFTTNEEQR